MTASILSSGAELLPLERLLAITDDLVVVVDSESRVQWMNEAFRQLLGLDSSTASSVMLTNFIHPDDSLPALDRARRALALGGPHGFVRLTPYENRYRDAQGSWRRLEWHTVRIGQNLYGVARDVTDRADREQRLVSAMNLAKLADFRWRVGGRTVLWTDRLAQVMPMAAPGERVTTRALFAAMAPASRGVVWQAVNQCRRLRVSVGSEFTVTLPDGDIRTYAVQMNRQRRAITGVVQDVTEGHRAEAAMLEAMHEAERASAAKSYFLAMMSHELRTPLNAILGFSEIMRDALLGPIPDRYRDYARVVHEAGAHLLSLINDVLDMSRLEAGRYPLSPEATDADRLVRDAVALLQQPANAGGLSLIIHSPTAVPMVADGRAIRQVLINLVSNAIKFTPAGGQIMIAVSADDHTVTFAVGDTGVGIPADKVATLGRPFVQVHSGAHIAGKGSGLGLAISRALVEQHGGTLQIESTLGHGTEVTVRLPRTLNNP
ncbi:MAG: PAS domain S-box protein [Alphaproteobacteria bacterium]|nr:MAG: PAS domain S-box protein [Alphaproteobacteria bacterium]